MSDTPQFKNRAVYSFDVYPVAILGASFANVTVMGTIDEATAREKLATAEIHAQVYPFLPSGTPDDPTAYDYLRFKTLTGETVTIGIPWIKPESVVLVDAKTLDITVGQVKSEDVTIIRNLLVQAGYKNLAMNLR